MRRARVAWAALLAAALLAIPPRAAGVESWRVRLQARAEPPLVGSGAVSAARALRSADSEGAFGLPRVGLGLAIRTGRAHATSISWSRHGIEALAGRLRLHLGVGCLLAEERMDALEPGGPMPRRSLQCATTLAPADDAPPGLLLRVARAGGEAAVWWTCAETAPAASLAAELERAAGLGFRGVAWSTGPGTLAVVRAPEDGRWRWSATLRTPGDLADGGRLWIEAAGDLVHRDAPTSAWDGAARAWEGRFAQAPGWIGGVWRLPAHRVMGGLGGAVRYPTRRTAGLASPGGRREGWRFTWALPALAGLCPVVTLVADREAAGTDGSGGTRRTTRFSIGAAPWSGAEVDLLLEGRAERRARSGEAIELSGSTFDLALKLDLGGGLGWSVRCRQRRDQQTMDPDLQPVQQELLLEEDAAVGSGDDPVGPYWLEPRGGSVTWSRLSWRGASGLRVGAGLANTPAGSSAGGLAPSRLAGGRTGWRTLAAGRQLAEAWVGLQRRSWTLDLLLRSESGRGGPERWTAGLGISWRGGGSLAGPPPAD